MDEVEQAHRRVARMGDLAQALASGGAGFNQAVFEGECPSCQDGCTTPREDHEALVALMDESTLAGWVECPGCVGCHGTWGSTVPPDRCSWGRNVTDDKGRISNEKCLNESKATLFVTDDDRPGVKSTLSLCVGHLTWMDEHMNLQRIDPARLS